MFIRWFFFEFLSCISATILNLIFGDFRPEKHQIIIGLSIQLAKYPVSVLIDPGIHARTISQPTLGWAK